MKIRKLHIKNYKVFNDLELDFTDANGKTLDTIVLAGLNGSGKTTVLEIIRKMFDDNTLFEYFEKSNDGFIEIEIEITSEEKEANIKRLPIFINNLNKNIFKGEHDFKIVFSNDNIIRFSFNSNADVYQIAELIFILSSGKPQTGESKLFYLPINDLEKRNLNNHSLEIIHFDSSKTKMKELALEEISNEIFKNQDTPPRKSKEKAIKQITKALNGMDLTTRLVDLESKELIFESVNGQKIKFEDLSSGEQSLYFRAIYLSKLNPENSIIMVDEPEDSLHPTWQEQVLKLYQNVGENNQVIVATHSPQVIGSANPNEVFLLDIQGNQIEAVHPRYTQGHSIKYILKEMGADPNDLVVIQKVDAYLELLRKGLAETKEGLAVKADIDAFDLDPNSEEMRRLSLSIKRFKAVGV